MTVQWGSGGAPRFLIATNSYGGVKPYYVSSLVETLREWWLRDWPVPEYAIVDGVYVPEARNSLLRTLRATGSPQDSDGVLWIEHDHRWTPEAVDWVLDGAARNPGAIVGAIYMARQVEKLVVGTPGERTNLAQCRGLVTMEAIGMGFTFTPWSVFDTLPQPWFETTFERQGLGHPELVSDDVVFCRKARAAGIPVLACLDAIVEHAYEPGPRPVPFLKDNRPA